MMDSPYSYALGWTLIHSIWQLTILAVLCYMIMVFFKNRQPEFRYYLSLLCMLISISVTSLTFILMYRKFSGILSPQDIARNAIPLVIPEQAPGDPAGIWETALLFLRSHVASLTYMYMTGVGLLFIRLGINYRSMNRLKYGSEPIDIRAIPFLQDLIEKMNINVNVRILSSPNVHIPMVIGAFKPLILIPASILTHASPGILEAVIAHELAHISRHDFLVNIFQSIFETLFFYHPAAWYFNYIARREREYCCDQMAVDAGCPREDLALALAEVGELQQTRTLSISLGGHSDDLLNRVKYLLGFKPSYHYMPDHSILYFGSLLGVFILFSIAKSHFLQAARADEKISSTIGISDTIPKHQIRTIEVRKSLLAEDSIKIDTFIDYRMDGMDGIEVEPFESLIYSDTAVRVIQTDTIPGQTKTVIIQSNRKIEVIVNGDTVSIFQQPDIRRWQDSLKTLHGQTLGIWSRQNRDSMFKSLQGINYKFQREFQHHQNHLDSLNRNLQGMSSQYRSFGLSHPDSLRALSYAYSLKRKMNVDSLMNHLNLAQNFNRDFRLDSLLHSNHDWSTTLMSDSSHFFFHPNLSGAYGIASNLPDSRALKELNKKIRAMERELMELRRELRDTYMEELQKEQNGEKK